MDIPEEVRQARAGFSTFYGEHGYRKFLVRKVLENPELLGVVRKFGRTFGRLLARKLPADSGLRLQLALFDYGSSPGAAQPAAVAPASTENRGLVYFPGCSATYLYPEILSACRNVFSAAGYDLLVPEGLGCCGLAMDAAGDAEQSREQAKKNILALERHAGPIMVSCGSCYAHLRRYQEVLADEPAWRDRVAYVCERFIEMSRMLDQCLVGDQSLAPSAGSTPTIRVFYHDPCHLRHKLHITREPRELLRRWNTVELLELPGGPQCCGQGGLFHLGAPELSAVIRDELAANVLALQPDVITSTCSGCLMQWKTALAVAHNKIPVLHLAELLVCLREGKPLH